MKAEIISVGTELLMGDITDTNSSKIARELLSIGIGTYHMQTVGDNPARIKEALVHAAKRSDLIILTGGLGPTQDDITKQVAADFLGDELVEDKAQIDKIISEYKKRGKVPTEMVHREALTFKRGETLFNDVGLACGCAAELKNAGKMTRHLILLPGVPYEMAYMLENEVKPYLRRHAEKETVIESLFMNFNDIGEPQVAEALDEQIQSQANPTIAIYAKPRHITVRISAKAADSKTASRMNQQAADRILEKLSEQFIGYGEEQTIETHVVELMKREKVTLSVAEEFTAGDIMSTLTKVAGVSSVFTGGLVTLTDQTR
ncbi:MAG: CinA family nicotinamide mononucleotide deamidase-related protein [Alkalibacterium sp.]|nr:CinA family nicotinamide mononucleotide deamidase-related protein [Alkalibacterium sp.]